jgi:hypothetical protein
MPIIRLAELGENRMKVSNMTTSNGNTAPNQFIIDEEHATVFQSYETTIAVISKSTGHIVLDINHWRSSRTTNRYRNQFLGMTTPAIEHGIIDQSILLSDLNG